MHKKKNGWLATALLYSTLCASQQRCDSLQNSLMLEIERLQAVNAELMHELTIIYSKPKDSLSQGIEYRVQLATGNRSPIFMNRPKSIVLTVWNKRRIYSIRGFSNSEDAYALASDLRRLDLTGVFVTKYVNGVRDKSFRYNPTLSKAENPSTPDPNTSPKVLAPRMTTMKIEE